ncbi:MAG: DUF3298 and DUF4163 domain-containing protein [Lachnospiraceae bacterium]|nr:DUF3298 and DUF4163 domain-containing protein [Lachnospiraceae bacterium]
MKICKVKKKSLTVLLTALLVVGAGACGTENSSDTDAGLEITDISDTGDTETAEPSDTDTENTDNAGETSDTDVTSDIPDAGTQKTPENPVTVTFRETLDETKADDGKVIFTSSAQIPVVSIDGAADIAEKINADLAAYYDAFSYDETLSMAEEDYAASLGEDGWDFLGYSTEISAEVTRMDDAVISFQIMVYDFTGGAHGNYGSIGKNYSTVTGELLAFDEISEDYEAFHATVLDYMVNQAETPAYKDKLFDNPSKDDLDSALFRTDGWVFTRSGISFLVPPYVLGPYASGEISFMLPYEKAYDLGLKEDYRYNGNFVDERYYIYKYDPETFEPVVDGTPDCYFDLDGDGTEEGLAFYGQVVDSATGESRYAFYIDGTDYGDIINDELQNIKDNGYMENTYALCYADAPDGGVPAIAVLFTEFGDGEDSNGNPVRHPRSFLFGYTKEKGLYYLYWDDGFVTLPATS